MVELSLSVGYYMIKFKAPPPLLNLWRMYIMQGSELVVQVIRITKQANIYPGGNRNTWLYGKCPFQDIYSIGKQIGLQPDRYSNSVLNFTKCRMGESIHWGFFMTFQTVEVMWDAFSLFIANAYLLIMTITAQ